MALLNFLKKEYQSASRNVGNFVNAAKRETDEHIFQPAIQRNQNFARNTENAVKLATSQPYRNEVANKLANYNPKNPIGRFAYDTFMGQNQSERQQSVLNNDILKSAGVPHAPIYTNDQLVGKPQNIQNTMRGVSKATADNMLYAVMDVSSGLSKPVQKAAAPVVQKGIKTVQKTIKDNVPVKGGVDIPTPKAPKVEAPKTRGLIQSAQESKLVSTQAKKQLTGVFDSKTNTKLVNDAVSRINKDPVKAHDWAIKTNSDEATATAITLAQQYRKAGKFDLEASLINEKARRLTEAGREVQAASLIDKMSPEGIVASTAQTIQKYNETATKKIPELTGAMAKQFSDIAEKIGKMAEGREKQIAIYQLKERVANLIPSSVLDKAVTVWKAGLLTSPRTTMRNIIGNTGHGIAEIAKDPFAVANDIALSLKTGRREVTSTLKGINTGAKKGVQAAKDIAILGFDPEKSIEKFDINHITWADTPIQQGLKKYTDIVFRNMGLQDKPFYHAAFARSLYDQAGAEAINLGKRGNKQIIDNLVKTPTERMLTNATKDAQLAVFQNPNIGSRLASKIKTALRDKNSGLGAVANIMMPFTGVPSSIAGQMISYSPIGLVKGIAKDIKVLANSVSADMIPDLQRQASQEIGRGVIGTGLLSLGAYLTLNGLMTGQPKDSEEQRQWELEGKQANSVFINGKWRSINSIGPEALVLLAGSKFAEGKDLGTTGAAIGKDFMSQTFLSGIQQPLNAISDPVRYGGTYISGQVASLIPNIIKDSAKALDPTQRETYVSKDLGQTTVNSVKAGLPGLRNTLLPKRDSLGNELKQEPTNINAFVDLFNSKTPISNNVVDELSRLNQTEFSATPSKPANSQTINGEKRTLTPQELDSFEKRIGEIASPNLNAVITSPEYGKLSDEAKKKVIDNVMSDAKTQAKVDLFGQEPKKIAEKTAKLKTTKAKSGRKIATYKGKKLSINTEVTKPTLKSKGIKLKNTGITKGTGGKSVSRAPGKGIRTVKNKELYG